jgi:hypothetical protein
VRPRAGRAALLGLSDGCAGCAPHSLPTEARLPGGTWITEHSLFGAWRVLVYLDNNATPVATPGSASLAEPPHPSFCPAPGPATAAATLTPSPRPAHPPPTRHLAALKPAATSSDATSSGPA